MSKRPRRNDASNPAFLSHFGNPPIFTCTAIHSRQSRPGRTWCKWLATGFAVARFFSCGQRFPANGSGTHRPPAPRDTITHDHAECGRSHGRHPVPEMRRPVLPIDEVDPQADRRSVQGQPRRAPPRRAERESGCDTRRVQARKVRSDLVAGTARLQALDCT